MCNAQDAVKEVADLITLTNDEDGVALVVEDYMLG
jgi:hydroxymethylpyrimidine pyrophosphatase-like HAD family hydrolase